MKRFLAGVLLAMGLVTLGFGIGGTAAAELLVSPAGFGFESAATVAMSASVGAIAGCITAIILAVRLKLRRLVEIAIIAFVLGTLSVAFFLWRGGQRKPTNSATWTSKQVC